MSMLVVMIVKRYPKWDAVTMVADVRTGTVLFSSWQMAHGDSIAIK